MKNFSRPFTAFLSFFCVLACVAIFYSIQEPAKRNHEYPRQAFLVVVKSDGFSNGVEEFIGVYEYEDFLFELPATAEQYAENLKSAVPVPATIMLSDVDLGAPYPYVVIVGLVAMAMFGFFGLFFALSFIFWNVRLNFFKQK